MVMKTTYPMGYSLPGSRKKKKSTPARAEVPKWREEWESRRQRVLSRSAGVCQRCGQGKPKMVHAKGCQSVFTAPEVDLLAVCMECYDGLHDADPTSPAR